MPAKTPPTGDAIAQQLMQIGERLRAYRKQHKVSAVIAAEAAGMARGTWHRIERGEPSVTMGAYLSAVSALGLSLEVVDPQQPADVHEAALPPLIALDDYPQLRRLAWQQRQGRHSVTPAEALALYERNWRHVETAQLDPAERRLVDTLVAALGGGRLLV